MMNPIRPLAKDLFEDTQVLRHARKKYINKSGIREKASHEDTDTEFLFAYLKQVANRCGNIDLSK